MNGWFPERCGCESEEGHESRDMRNIVYNAKRPITVCPPSGEEARRRKGLHQPINPCLSPPLPFVRSPKI